MNRLNQIIALFFLVLALGCASEENESEEKVSAFNEPYRPQFHFTPATNWMNDPNGMVYYDGEYHLFYQHHPEGNVWGPMHWGHAISTDLVHWEHMPVALAPDELGTIFSGSAVMDLENTSGLGTEEAPAMVAIFTYHDAAGADAGREDFQTQGIAYSTDKGRSWTKYEGNPVLKNPGIRDFRDPKVAWVEAAHGQGKWIMTLAVKDKISFYSSPNLLDWTFESNFNPEWAAYGGVWECPDLFTLTTAEGEEKWILFVSINPGGPNGGSATQYFIGDFDGSNFTVESNEILWLDYGTDNYAGVTWSNVPEADGRRLFIGWMSNWNYANIVPTEVWRSAMTLPRSLHLIKRENEFLVASKPVEELEKIRATSKRFSDAQITLTEELVELELQPQEADFSVEFSNDAGEKLLITKVGDTLSLDRSNSGETAFSEVFGTVHHAPISAAKADKVHLFLDRSSIEVFINDGETVMTDIIFPTKPYTDLKLTGFGETNTLYYLESIW
jgi:fructan beta-fructosidase